MLITTLGSCESWFMQMDWWGDDTVELLAELRWFRSGGVEARELVRDFRLTTSNWEELFSTGRGEFVLEL